MKAPRLQYLTVVGGPTSQPTRPVFAPFLKVKAYSLRTRKSEWSWSRPQLAQTSSIYQKLDHERREIRVIKILPGKPADKVVCDLERVSLNYRPRYDTLSYTWGDPHLRFDILVNGRATSVSQSLANALRTIRHKRNIVTLWADALCINQNDVSEKNVQVAMMGRIYRQGKQTWVFLGSPEDDWATGQWSPAPKIEESLKLIKRLVRGVWRLFWHHVILRRSRASRLGVNHVSDAVRLMKSLESKQQLTPQDFEDQKIAQSMLTWLVTHQYWTRVWVMQEIGLSKVDPICIFGTHRVPLLSLDTVLRDWQENLHRRDGAHNIVQGWLPEYTAGFDRTFEMFMLRDELLRKNWVKIALWRRRGELDIIRCLKLTSHRFTSVAHDHVYGLHSLLPLEAQDVFRPDYGVPLPQLYANVTKFMLKQSKSIKLLCAASGTATKRNNHNLPSWAIDFSKPIALPTVNGDNLSDIHDLNGEDTTSILYVEGHDLLDTVIITHQTEDAEWERIENSVHDGEYSELEAAATKLLRDCYVAALSANLEVNIFQLAVLLASKVYEVDNTGTFTKGSIGIHLSREEQVFRERLKGRFQDALSESTRDNNSLPEVSSFLIDILCSFMREQLGFPGRNDNFFCTRNGNFGKCTGDVQVGDELWRLSGSSVAFVLRKYVGDPSVSSTILQYQLVGPCKLADPGKEGADNVSKDLQQIQLI